MEVLHNSQKFRVLWHGRTELTEVPGGYKKCCTRTPGIVARGVQNSQKFRVRCECPTELTRSSGYGYESLTELAEVPGIVARAYRSYRSSGYGYERRTGLAEVLCTGMNVIQNSQKFRG